MDAHPAPPAVARPRGPWEDCRQGLASYWPYIKAAIDFRQKELKEREGLAELSPHPLPLDLGRFLAEVAKLEGRRLAELPQDAAG